MHITEISGFISYVFAQATQNQSVLSFLQEKFVEGGIFMWPILGCLVLGLAFSIERFWTLMRATTNTKKFVVQIKDALKKGGVPEAIKLCENTRGSIASVFHAGLLRADEGIEAAEKSIMAYGAIEMGFLERGLIWISTFISLAPLLGFTGTVQGMIIAFDAIKEAAQISPSIVAGGIAVALLTTLFGLVVAMILQVFYNYFVSKIDRLVADMEESSIELIDTLYEMNKK
ncbi:MotA/TolQ/ExbB proton channel family protein [Melioribacteraceae bacterium 4301-Me]|uniref:MotA/TolQ/ExbB proton channel family protein n=1 Tax=Pyranulibacter aquaticus TaxID=3163344 RepID=UPI00359B283E